MDSILYSTTAHSVWPSKLCRAVMMSSQELLIDPIQGFVKCGCSWSHGTFSVDARVDKGQGKGKSSRSQTAWMLCIALH